MNEFENNEMYENEALEGEVDYVDMDAENTGLSTGAVVAITAATTFVATVVVPKVVGFVKNAWHKHKEKKALRQPDADEAVEPTDEQLNEVTQK